MAKWQRANLDFDRVKFLYEKANKENVKLAESCKKEIKEILSQELEADNRYKDLVNEREQFREKERILLNTFDLWKSKFDQEESSTNKETRNYECSKCVYEGVTQSDLRQHEKDNHSHKEFKCEECGHIVLSEKDLDGHMDAYHDSVADDNADVQIIYICDNCDEEYKTNGALQEHMKDIHSQNEIDLSCDKCEYKGKSQGDLESHRKSNHFYFRYFCCVCDFVTLNKDLLRTHKMELHGAGMNQLKREKVLPPPKCNLKDASHTSSCCDRKLGTKKPVIFTHEQRESNGICTDWNKGNCKDSDLCRFSHKEMEACRYAEFCSRTNCRYWHDIPGKFPFLDVIPQTRRQKW